MVMKDLYITHYCEPGKIPLQSITRLPKDQAFSKAKEFSVDCKSKRNRFGPDFTGYYPKRIRTEEWLYQSFITQGGLPVTKHPIYFVLMESERLHQWFGNGPMIKIPLSKIPSDYISFTLGDSMSVIDRMIDKKLYRKEELIKEISASELSIFDYLRNVDSEFGYIEAQVWNDTFLETMV